jgi:hypothetical protein
MSEKTKTFETLEIFKSLKTYFAILCENNCDDNSDKKCDELINILTHIDCKTEKNNLTDNFKNALKWFAVELKKADSPIGFYTIKKSLKEIFNSFENSDTEKIEKIINFINTADYLNGFKMSDNNGEGKSYENILISINNLNKDLDNNELFDIWVNESFKLYSENKIYFQNEIKNKIINIDECEKKILNLFFDIKIDNIDNNGIVGTVSVEKYIKNFDLYRDKEARLNTIVKNDKANIINLLPKIIRGAFNKYLIKFDPINIKPEFIYISPECYKLKEIVSSPFLEYMKIDEEKSKYYEKDKYDEKKSKYEEEKSKYEEEKSKYEEEKKIEEIPLKESEKEIFKVENIELVLEYFKKTALSMSDNKTQKYIVDKEDDEMYYDSDDMKTNYKWPEDFEIHNYTDKWRIDNNGNLYKKNESGKFVKYTEEEQKNDIKSFESKEGKCGHLCIFEDINECIKFFEDMVNGKVYQTEKLSEIINRSDFVRIYKALKENIINVNPLFIIGTLKMFGFDKYTKLNDDNTKTIQIESFSRWWNRQNIDGKLSDKLKPNSIFPGSHKGLIPEPPANLELFFKLLIAFINNNEFVLNPTSKEINNKTGKPVLKSIGSIKDAPDNFIINGKNYPNELKIKELSKKTVSKNESLSELLNIMKKNSMMNSKSNGIKSSESILNLNTLLGLMIGVTNGGKIKLSKSHAFSTGLGYIVGGSNNIYYGGNDDDDIKLLPCSANAVDIYRIGVESLKKNNKILDSNVQNKLENELTKLSEAELKVYNQLKVLASYIKIINILNDNSSNNEITENIMNKALQDYDNKSSKLSDKADNTISLLLKNLYQNINTSNTKSFYSKI